MSSLTVLSVLRVENHKNLSVRNFLNGATDANFGTKNCISKNAKIYFHILLYVGDSKILIVVVKETPNNAQGERSIDFKRSEEV